jgi:hypothetical protein
VLTSERHDCGSADDVSGGRETADRVVGDGAGERHGCSFGVVVCIYVLLCVVVEGYSFVDQKMKDERGFEWRNDLEVLVRAATR